MRFLSYEDLRARGIRFSKMHIHRLVRAGKFPRPVKLGMGANAANAWPEHEIDAWSKNRVADRDGAAVCTIAARP